jgi:hypothetical protein
VNNSIQYKSPSEIINTIRAQLADKTHDDIHFLVKIFTDLKNLDADRLSPYDASHWLIQKQTEREARLEEFTIQVGFNKGIVLGFLLGFVVCAFIAVILKSGG